LEELIKTLHFFPYHKAFFGGFNKSLTEEEDQETRRKRRAFEQHEGRVLVIIP